MADIFRLDKRTREKISDGVKTGLIQNQFKITNKRVCNKSVGSRQHWFQNQQTPTKYKNDGYQNR